MKLRIGVAILLLASALAAPVAAKSAAGSARTLYTRALERERQVRAGDPQASLKQLRSAVNAYEALVRRFPASGYCDNALWQAGNLALFAFERFGEAEDRRTGERLLTRLKEGYPSSSLIARADVVLAGLGVPDTAAASRPAARADITDHDSERPAATTGVDAAPAQATPQAPAAVMIRDIKRAAIPEGMRVTIEMDSETSFRAERLENPRRVFFDLKGTRPVPSLLDATLRFDDEIVREIRLGRHPQTTTRIVFDMAGVDSYSVFTLYSPYRLVIDFKPLASAASNGAPSRVVSDPVRNASVSDTPAKEPSRKKTERRATPDALGTTGTRRAESSPIKGPSVTEAVMIPDPPSIVPAPLPASTAPVLPAETVSEPPAKPAAGRGPVAVAPVPAVPSANSDGKFSLSRQLGLGVSRIVIDAGHGGHDPGAQSNGVSESELTLDVALRLSRLLAKQPGVDVVLTRDSDVFIPLEERTSIANREGADLFLSIHANASRNSKARGVETYFLNFASNPAAEAVAARENSASGRAMHSLPDIVRAIALNNKIDESRDFADMVQRSMVRRLSTRNKQLKDLGVKQAPFVVLIGAAMPSVLAEISFVTHKQEGQLLKSTAYRQQIAEALLDAVVRYQQSLKRPRAGVFGMETR
jgi:N-acetylmuramoyl-L-alanine amidase